MYFKCIWWHIYLGVISCVLLYMCAHTGLHLGLHGAGSVTAGGTGGCCDDILWYRGVAGSAVWCLICVCMYVCLLTIKKEKGNTRVSHKMKHYSRRQNRANAKKIVNIIPYIRIYVNLYVKPEAKMKKILPLCRTNRLLLNTSLPENGQTYRRQVNYNLT